MPNDAEVTALLETLRREGAARRRRGRLAAVLGIAFGTAVTLLLFDWLIRSVLSHEVRSFASPLFRFGTFLWCVVLLARASKRERRLIREAARVGDKRLVGPLVEALEFDDKEARALARTAVISLLFEVTEGDGGLLDAKQREILREQLARWRDDTPLTVAILAAFGAIGGQAEMEAVQRIASVRTDWAKNREVTQAAARALPLLQARVERDRAAATLLRPTAQGEETLLRPAAGSAEHDSELLLRPSSDCEEGGQADYAAARVSISSGE